jgi:hypothetical protein
MALVSQGGNWNNPSEGAALMERGWDARAPGKGFSRSCRQNQGAPASFHSNTRQLAPKVSNDYPDFLVPDRPHPRLGASSVMWRNLVARATRYGNQGLDLFVKHAQLFLQQIDPFLLAEYRPIQFFEQILGEAQIDFQFRQPLFHHPAFPTPDRSEYKIAQGNAA